jgi:hypothetical protein
VRPPRSRRWLTVLAAVAVLAGVLGWQWHEAGVEAKSAGSGSHPDSGPMAPGSSASSALGGPATPATREQQLALWQQRFTRAEAVYNSYRDATRYPPESRPLSEHTDQARPFDPIAEDVPLRDASGKPLKGVHIRTTRDRVFVSGGESVRFSIQAADENGRSLPLVIERSEAQGMPDNKTLNSLIRADVPFNDDGTAPDDTAGDGKYSALLTPVRQGFANHNGTIRLLVDVSANGQTGVVPFDVVYVPSVPATWAGSRETLEDGALNFYLKAQVRTAGRYVVAGRVYDAAGAPLALLQFNDQVPAGPAEFKLSLAGVLVRDKNPVFPLSLVDVEGFLLQPDTFPDRAMMPRQPGTVHVSKRYDVNGFSGDEWQSEERTRYLDEYGRDMQRALSEMVRLKGK